MSYIVTHTHIHARTHPEIVWIEYQMWYPGSLMCLCFTHWDGIKMTISKYVEAPDCLITPEIHVSAGNKYFNRL